MKTAITLALLAVVPSSIDSYFSYWFDTIWLFSVNSRQLDGPVRRVQTAARARRLCGAGTKMATPSATPAVYTSNCTTSVSSATTSSPCSVYDRSSDICISVIFIGPHSLHAVNRCGPLLHVSYVRSVWSVCPCVGKTFDLCKSGWIDRDAVWKTDSCDVIRNHKLELAQIPSWKGTFVLRGNSRSVKKDLRMSTLPTVRLPSARGGQAYLLLWG